MAHLALPCQPALLCAVLSVAAALPGQKPRPGADPNQARGEITMASLFPPRVPPTGVPGGKYGGRLRGRARLARAGKDYSDAIENALSWLAKHQSPDGRWDVDGFMKMDTRGAPCDGKGHAAYDVGVTAYALLAFLQDGQSTTQGTHRDAIRKGLVWLARQQDPKTGQFGLPTTARFLHHHAVATLAMVESYGFSQNARLRPFANRALAFLELQRPDGGIWRSRVGEDDEDLVVTAWATLAYRAGADFKLGVQGLPVLRKIFAAREASAEPRAAAGSLVASYFLGLHPVERAAMEAEADTVLDHKPSWSESNDLMAWFLGTRAIYQIGRHDWLVWSRALTASCKGSQRSDGNFAGSWDPAARWGKEGGRVYSTALMALSMESYYAYTRMLVR